MTPSERHGRGGRNSLKLYFCEFNTLRKDVKSSILTQIQDPYFFYKC